MTGPRGWDVPDHAEQAALHLLALAREYDPQMPQTAEMHDAAAALIVALAAALTTGRAR